MKRVQDKSGVFLFTVEQLEGYVVEEYYGMVTGRALYGANFVKDFFARLADTFGGRARGYENAVQGAMEAALLEMALDASRRGANAIIGIDVDTGAVGGRMLLATCYGTAVRIRPAA